ncbi:MAG TPA: hypothetical protein VNL16_09865 [Chloroflexota bacterium]|nr:hypothetical protein [Chloroflexota bacterium]
MQIGSGEHTYAWIDRWARIPDTETARLGWAHHAVVATADGKIIAFHPGDPTTLVFDRDGNLQSAWNADLAEAHGMTVVQDGGTEYLWIADQGAKRALQDGYTYQMASKGWQVVKTTLDGKIVARLSEPPPLALYAEKRYAPTWVAVNEERHGGNGDVWVTDGYGQSYVHRYNNAGAYVGSINGEEGRAGAFACPHAIWVDPRKAEPELYVADRTNHRIQVYDLDGRFKRVFGSDFLSSPSAFARIGDRLVIGELRARLTILDENDQLVCYLGENEAVCGVDGWPNVKDEQGAISRTDRLEPGRFNSPHGLAADGDGNLYVSEWLIGGRFTKLAKI